MRRVLTSIELWLWRAPGIRCATWVLIPVMLVSCSDTDSAKERYFSERLQCPPPAVEKFEPWGQSGSQHVCELKEGPFVAFENGHVAIRGQYFNGKETGIWRWYRADGRVVKEVDYSHGN